ncbi:MAG: hypothetical protein WCX79_01460 [Candidatus Paceibacterota bacterium]|jgi:hypothetical protein
MNKRDVLDSRKLKKAKLRKKEVLGKRIILILIIFVFCLIALVFVSRSEKLSINSIEITGINPIDGEILKNKVKDILSEKYLLLFPKRSIIFLPRKNIIEKVKSEYLIYKDIDINLDGLNTLKINITERYAQYLWCGNNFILSQEKKTCYFMDEEGYIYSSAPYFSGDVYFKFFGGISSDYESPIGHTFLKEKIKEIDKFRKMLKSININPVSLFVKEDGDMEFYLLSLSSSIQLPPRIIFNIDSGYEKLTENLEIVFGSEQFLNEYENSQKELEYIDLRFGNKVYYRFR